MKFDDALPDELPLVFDAWARSFKKSPYAGCVTNKDWDQVSRNTASEIIDRGAMVLVGYQETTEGVRRVMGYSVSEPGVLHWLFMKRDWRGMGFGRQLLKATTDAYKGQREMAPTAWRYTHRTRASTRFLGPSFTWDPVPARIKQ